MNKLYKVTSKYILVFASGLLFYSFNVQSKNNSQNSYSFHNNLTAHEDTVIPRKKRVITNGVIQRSNPVTPGQNSTPDTTIVNAKIDTVDLKISKDTLDAPVEYSADDSMIMDVPSKKITLYGKKTTTHYKDNELSAPVIEFDQETNNIIASIRRDSTGKVISMPTFRQGPDFISQSDSIRFNMKTGKGLTKSTYTQQGEMYVYGDVIKKISNDIFFAQHARITTCNLDTPHFAFVSNKIKFISGKMAITGPVHPEFEGVPIPIYLPFGIYPLNPARHSGFLAPNFTSNEQLGLGLEGLGYYKVLSDYWDVAVRANIYSYGGWTMSISPRYTKRYRYTGSISFDMQDFKYNFKGDPDYSINKSYHLSWTHAADSKARPGVSFSANVNAGSSSYNSFVPDNPYKNFSNQLTSSIVYSKTGDLRTFGDSWRDKTYNLTISANHNQNTQLKLINVNLPDVAFNLSTLYPFKSKDVVGVPKWYENIGIAYNGEAKSLFSFYDTVPHIFQHIKDTLQWGAHHSLPISLSLPQVGAFQFSPNISYDETWYQRKFVRSWDNTEKKVDTTITRGFYSAREISFGMGVSTKIIGMFTSKNKDADIQAIRHEIRPSISFNYNPDLNKRNYYVTQVDSLNDKGQFSVFEGNIFSPYGQGSFGGISFGIDNNIQMKVRNKKDTAANATKHITLIDGLSINGSYNLIADSFQLSNFIMSAHTTIFNGKLNITAGANLDPYDVDARGMRLKSLLWSRKPLSFGRLTNANISISSSFQGGGKTNKTNINHNDLLTNDYASNNGYTPDEYQTELAYIRSNPAEFADFNIPWSVNFSYSLTFTRLLKPDYTGFTDQFDQNVNFSGTLNLTPKWQMGLNGYYNITQQQLGLLTLSISREMHCWQMGINLSPVGKYRFYSISISPKSPLLRDLRINRTRSTNVGF